MFEPNREDTQYCLSVSYGKDSLACIGACEKLGWRIDRIIHAEIWATQDISADLPPMVNFKAKADKIIKSRYGIDVEHYTAKQKNDTKKSFQDEFYTVRHGKTHDGVIYGFPMRIGNWCTSDLKVAAINKAKKSIADTDCGKKTVSFIGIALDEPERLARLDGITKISPLEAIGWTEADCMKWCIENDLKSPIYDNSTRGGCWFCHNQSTDQLRRLRKEYPNLWGILMKWDSDSPTTFKANCKTVHDYDARFQLEDEGFVNKDDRWSWEYLKHPPCVQLSFFDS